MKFTKAPFISSFIRNLNAIFFPQLCAACDQLPALHQEVVCLHCLARLPKTNHHQDKENPFTDRFIGRVRLNTGAAFLYFGKETKTQRLIHQLKYEGRRDIGVKLGEAFGKVLLNSPHFKDVDLVVPVPLHHKRLIERGYNQSTMIAQGMAKQLGIEVNEHALLRTRYTETQTKKTRLERSQNIQNAFYLSKGLELEGKHILLIDDVMTTGATLEACALAIGDNSNAKISMATLAFAGV